MGMSDFHNISGFALNKKVHLGFQVGEPFFFVLAKDILHSTCGYHSTYNYVNFSGKRRVGWL